jgi:sulfite exporter TauE/SafE
MHVGLLLNDGRLHSVAHLGFVLVALAGGGNLFLFLLDWDWLRQNQLYLLSPIEVFVEVFCKLLLICTALVPLDRQLETFQATRIRVKSVLKFLELSRKWQRKAFTWSESMSNTSEARRQFKN